MGWKIITGSLDPPSVTGHESFREVLIKDDLVKALRRVNHRARAEFAARMPRPDSQPAVIAFTAACDREHSRT
jgi:hypothetical protein